MLVFLVSVCVYKVVVQLDGSFFSSCCSCVFLLTVLVCFVSSSLFYADLGQTIFLYISYIRRI